MPTTDHAGSDDGTEGSRDPAGGVVLREGKRPGEGPGQRQEKQRRDGHEEEGER